MEMFLKKQSCLKNRKTKGFTLVEVIVVIVIIAILAAIAVPALTGYIGKSRERAAIVEARAAVQALTTMTLESYANGAEIYGTAQWNTKYRTSGGWNAADMQSTQNYLEAMNTLTGDAFTKDNFILNGSNTTFRFAGTGGKGHLVELTYVTNDKQYKVVYNAKSDPQYKASKI